MTWRSLVAAAALLTGCAAHPVDSSALAPEAAPDCSFHAATSCWTIGARVPMPRRETLDTAPDRVLSEPPAVLASRGDTAAVR
jgi:hypothetical protein